MNGPSGPLGRGPRATPGRTLAKGIFNVGGGLRKDTPGPAQKPLMKITESPRCS